MNQNPVSHGDDLSILPLRYLAVDPKNPRKTMECLFVHVLWHSPSCSALKVPELLAPKTTGKKWLIILMQHLGLILGVVIMLLIAMFEDAIFTIAMTDSH